MTEAGKSEGRDEHGRFAAGNGGGPGNPLARQATKLRRAAQEAISPEHIAALMRKALRMGLEGNLAAMRLVLERALGRPVDTVPETEPLDIDAPRMATAADCNATVGTIIDAVVKGAINQDSAKLLLAAVQTRVKAIETTELEERLAELEQAMKTVDGPRARRR